jgi:CDP-diacylglycerol--serine O-phosphatidyltransferase
VICIVIAHLCDGLDGRIARLTNTTSQFGVEYDSLADLVAFGVAPGILAYRWALEPWGAWGWLAVSLFVACGALRLARFNVQSSYSEKRTFIGLPIPAAADMIAATVLLYYFFGGQGATTTAPRPSAAGLRAGAADGRATSATTASRTSICGRTDRSTPWSRSSWLVKFVVAEAADDALRALVATSARGRSASACPCSDGRPRRIARLRRRQRQSAAVRGLGA